MKYDNYSWVEFGNYMDGVRVYVFDSDGDIYEKRIFHRSDALLDYKSSFTSLNEVN